MTDSDELRGPLIKSMVGRPLNNLFPPRRKPPSARRSSGSRTGPSTPRSDLAGRVDRVLPRARRRDRRLRGTHGGGPYRTSHEHLRTLLRHGICGTGFEAASRSRPATVDEAIANGIAYVTEDRKRYGLNLIGGHRGQRHRERASRRARSAGRHRPSTGVSPSRRSTAAA